MNVVARAMAFIEVTITAKVEKVELVNQAVALQEINGAVDGDASDARVKALGALKNLGGVEVAPRCFHHLKQNAALAGEPDATGGQFLLQASRRLMIDAFAGGNAMC